MVTLCTVNFVGLAKGNVLQCFLSLLEEIKIFVTEKCQPVSHSEDASWVCDLAFLTNICGQLNDLNSKLEEKCQLVCELYNYVSAF
jgi:hypothetical protein